MVTRVSSKMIDGLAEEVTSKFEEIGLTGVVSEWDEQEAETTDKAMAPAAVSYAGEGQTSQLVLRQGQVNPEHLQLGVNLATGLANGIGG